MPKRIIAAVFLLFCAVFLYGQEDYENVFLSWIEGNSGSAPVLARLEELYRDAENISSLPDRLYRQARISLALGQLYYFEEKGEQSLPWLEKSRSLAEELIGRDSRADAWRIMSDAGSFLMIQKGVGYIISNSPKVQEQAEKALEIDGTNARAGLIIAQGLMNAPALFGGDKKKGISDMEALSRRSDLNGEDRFYILMALAEAYDKARKKDLARDTYRQIVELYPGNPLALKRLKDYS